MNDLKDVILIGDSTRERYQSDVREFLDGVVNVWAPEDNCRTSAYVLEHLEEWVLNRPRDLVHINCGLHDLQYMHDLTRPKVPIDEYEINLRSIFARLVDAGVSFVWATSTPINEDWYNCKPYKRRYEADVQAYNARALKVAAEYDIAVNDLYETVCQTGRDDILDPDGVHYTPRGSRVLGEVVSRCIRQTLGV